MPTQVDELSDKALAASKAAFGSHDPGAHKTASEAHQEAYRAAGAAQRPSLAQSHLQQAALHDRHADPTTYEGKASIARRATLKARQSDKLDDHKAAEQAHRDASDAQSTKGGGDIDRGNHGMMAHEHAMAADRIQNPRPRPMGL